MAVNVGTLTIDLKANTASFSEAMDKMSELSAKTAKDISRSLMKISAASVAVIGAWKATLLEMVHSALEAGDALNSMSQATGTTVETLSTLQYAAALSGVETEALNVSLMKLAKAELEAATGNVELARVFKKLGVDVQDSHKHLKDTGLTFEELAVKFGKMKDGPVKTALAIQLFGKAGAQLIPLLNEMAEDFEKVQQEAQKMGLVMSTSVARLSSAAHEQLSKLHLILKGISYSILSGVLPAMSDLINKLEEIAAQADIPGLAKSFGEQASRAVITLGNALAFAAKHAQALKIALEALAAVQLGRVLLPLISDLATGGWAKLGKGVGEFATKLLGLSKVIPILEKFASWVVYEIRFIGMLAAETNIATAASYALRTALAAIGGPVTLIIAGITALGVALYELKDHMIELEGESYKFSDIYKALWKAATTSNYATFGGQFANALEQAKAERLAAEKAAAQKALPPKPPPPPGKDTDLTGLGKPQADPYAEAIKKLNLAITTQKSYLAVLHGTPEAIAAVTAEEKAAALILEINTKLKEKDKKLTADQEAEIRARVAKEENLKATVDFGKALVEQGHQAELTTAQTSVLTNAYKFGEEAVRQATVANIILGLGYQKTEEQMRTMRAELEKLAPELLKSLDERSLQTFSNAIVDQGRQAELTTKQNLNLANAYGISDRAVREATIKNTLLALQLNKTDAEIQKMNKDLENLMPKLDAAADALAQATAAQNIEGLKDQIEAEQMLTAAVFDGIAAQREAAIAAKMIEIDRQIAATTNKELIKTLEEVKAKTEAVMRAQFAHADANSALALRSPAKVWKAEDEALTDQIKAMKNSKDGLADYETQLIIAGKELDNFNKYIDQTVALFLRTGTAADGVRMFFFDMQKEAASSARIVYDVLHSAFDKLSGELANLITTGKADFAAMFKDLGKQMVQESIKAGLQKMLGSLFKGGARDGSSPQKSLFVTMAGAPPVLPGPAKPGGAKGSENDVFGKLKDMLGGLWSRLGSLFGSIGHSLGGFFGFLSGVIPHAEGGMVSPGSAYLVGERGPEILMGTSGSVLSHDASRRIALGGATPSVHYYTIDARGTDPVLTEQRTRSAIIAAHNSAVMTSGQVQRERTLRSPQRSK